MQQSVTLVGWLVGLKYCVSLRRMSGPPKTNTGRLRSAAGISGKSSDFWVKKTYDAMRVSYVPEQFLPPSALLR